MRIPFAAAVIMAMAVPVTADDVRYTFVVSTNGQHPVSERGTIVSRGDCWRLDLDARSNTVRAFDSVIANNSGLTAIDHRLKTWYRLNPGLLPAETSRLFGIPLPGRASVRGLVVRESASTLDFRYETSLALESGDNIKARVHGRVTAFPSHANSTSIPFPKALMAFTTRFPDVDAVLQPAIARLARGASRLEITVARTLQGGATITETIVKQADILTVAEDTPGVFEVPADYKHQEPAIGFVRP